jgi:hypothetical protein
MHRDLRLVFAKECSDVVEKRDHTLGQPLQMNNLAPAERMTGWSQCGRKADQVLRPACATLLLQAREPVHVVSERLGHSKVSMTMKVYAHVLPDMHRGAAAPIGALLHGWRRFAHGMVAGRGSGQEGGPEAEDLRPTYIDASGSSRVGPPGNRCARTKRRQPITKAKLARQSEIPSFSKTQYFKNTVAPTAFRMLASIGHFRSASALTRY